MAQVRWATRARDDLRDIYEFIHRDSPRVAATIIDRIVTATERLAEFPESGRTVPEFPHLPYREIIVGPFRTIYRCDGNAVWILAVVHGRQVLREP